eukprot:863018-Prorocentrum_minimum.AAC.1
MHTKLDLKHLLRGDKVQRHLHRLAWRERVYLLGKAVNGVHGLGVGRRQLGDGGLHPRHHEGALAHHVEGQRHVQQVGQRHVAVELRVRARVAGEDGVQHLLAVVRLEARRQRERRQVDGNGVHGDQRGARVRVERPSQHQRLLHRVQLLLRVHPLLLALPPRGRGLGRGRNLDPQRL